VWVLVGVCASAEGFVLAAFAAFLPKFFESQIDLTPAESSQYVGAVVIIFGSIGELGHIHVLVCAKTRTTLM
jgi:hypothetical protein